MSQRQHQDVDAQVTRLRVGHYIGVFAKTNTGYSAHVPSLPGLGVAGATLEETTRLLSEGINIHLAGLERDKHERPWLYATPATQAKRPKSVF